MEFKKLIKNASDPRLLLSETVSSIDSIGVGLKDTKTKSRSQ